MPIYEYVCTECDKRFERLVRVVTQIASADCPACHGTGIRVPSTFASFTVAEGGQTLPMAGGGCACGGN